MYFQHDYRNFVKSLYVNLYPWLSFALSMIFFGTSRLMHDQHHHPRSPKKNNKLFVAPERRLEHCFPFGKAVLMGYLKFRGCKCNLTNHLSKTSLVNFEFMSILGIMISDQIRIFPCQNAPIITGSYLTYHKLEGLDTPLWDIVGIPKSYQNVKTIRSIFIPPSCFLAPCRCIYIHSLLLSCSISHSGQGS